MTDFDTAAPVTAPCPPPRLLPPCTASSGRCRRLWGAGVQHVGWDAGLEPRSASPCRLLPVGGFIPHLIPHPDIWRRRNGLRISFFLSFCFFSLRKAHRQGVCNTRLFTVVIYNYYYYFCVCLLRKTTPGARPDRAAQFRAQTSLPFLPFLTQRQFSRWEQPHPAAPAPNAPRALTSKSSSGAPAAPSSRTKGPRPTAPDGRSASSGPTPPARPRSAPLGDNLGSSSLFNVAAA